MIIYMKLDEKQQKENNYPDNTWFALVGIPPAIEIFCSTHIFECAQAGYPEVAKELAKKTGQEW